MLRLTEAPEPRTWKPLHPPAGAHAEVSGAGAALGLDAVLALVAGEPPAIGTEAAVQAGPGKIAVAPATNRATLAVIGSTASASASSDRLTDDLSDHALRADTARTTFKIDGGTTSTGSTIRIGILSDSFNFKGGAASDEADGDLPPAGNVHILQDYAYLATDEGRAMAELVHRIAPGAQLYFYTAENGQAAFAGGIKALAAAGCQIIIDDVSYMDEPFYQAGGTVQQAIDTVTQQGVSYFTSASNNGHDYYESTWANLANYKLPDFAAPEDVHNVGNGAPYETFTMAGHSTATFDLQWAAPFQSLGGAGDTFSLGLIVYDMTSGTPVLSNVYAPDNALGGDPVTSYTISNTSSDTSFAAVFYQYAGTTPSGAFKMIFVNSGFATFTGLGSGAGSGTMFGHNADPAANPTGAVFYGNTAQSGNVPQSESFSSTGGTTLYYDAQGNLLTTPETLADPAFSATDGDTTSVLFPFYGTSAAAPNAGAVAALVLAEDGRLTNTQISYILGSTAVAFGDSSISGDGLIDAVGAVGAAHAAVTTPVWTGQGGTDLWDTAANWSDGAAPTASTAVQIGNGIGLLTGRYAIIDTAASSRAGALDLDGAGAALPVLAAMATPTLTVAAGASLNATSLTIGLGELDVAGRVTDAGALACAASAVAGAAQAVIESGGDLEIGAGDAVCVRFAGTTGTLQFDGSGSLRTGLTGAITGFAASDMLDLAGLAASAVAAITIAGSSVHLLDASQNLLAALTLSGAFGTLGYASDGRGGTLITAGASNPAPAVTFSTMAVGAGGVLTFSGTVSPANGVEVDVFSGSTRGGTATVDASSGTWSLSLTPPPGTYSGLHAVATDGVGRSATAAAAFGFTAGVTGEPYTTIETALGSTDGTTSQRYFNSNGSLYVSKTVSHTADGDIVRTYSGGSYFNGRSYDRFTSVNDSSGTLTSSTYSGATGHAYTSYEDIYSHGSLSEKLFTGIQNQTYSSYSNVYDASGSLATRTTNYNNGTHGLKGLEDGVTLTSIAGDTMTGGGASVTFLFNTGYGHDKIVDFSGRVSGTGHDTMSVAEGEFSSFSALLAATKTVGANAVISGSGGDTITLSGMTKTTIAANPGDFVFHA